MTMKKIVRTGALTTMALLASNTAYAESCTSGLNGYCLTDGNASFSIVHHDVGGTAKDEFGMEMNLDSVTQIFVVDYMVDRTSVAGTHNGTESYLNATSGVMTGTNEVNINGGTVSDANGTYGTVNLGLKLDYLGIDAVFLTQTFTFTNTTNATITDLSFIGLTDVSLGGNSAGFNDRGELTTGTATNPTGYRQWSNNNGQDFELLAQVDVPVDSYEVSAADFSQPCSAGSGDLCDRIYNNDTVTLSNSILPIEEDLMMAARWLTSVASGGTFSYTQTFEIFDPLTRPVTQTPVPAAAWLFASGLLGLVGVARRKQSI